MKNVILRNDSLEYKVIVNASMSTTLFSSITFYFHVEVFRYTFVDHNIKLLPFFCQTCVFGMFGQSRNLCTPISTLWESSVGFHHTDFWFLGTSLILSVYGDI